MRVAQAVGGCSMPCGFSPPAVLAQRQRLRRADQRIELVEIEHLSAHRLRARVDMQRRAAALQQMAT